MHQIDDSVRLRRRAANLGRALAAAPARESTLGFLRGILEEVRFAVDSPSQGAGFEPSVLRERVCAFRDRVHCLQSVRRPLRSKWYIDDSDGPLVWPRHSWTILVGRCRTG